MINIYYKTFKNFLKSNYNIYFLFVDDDIKKYIIEIQKFTKRFIVLKDINYVRDDFVPHVSLICKNKNDFVDVLEQVFVQKKSLLSDNITTKLPQNVIAFISTDVEDDNIKVYEMLYLFDILPEEYFINEIEIEEKDNIVLSFTNTLKKVDFVQTPKPVSIFIGNGIGDMCIIGSTLLELVKQQNEVFVVIPEKCKVINMITELFPNCKIVKFDNIHVLQKIFPLFVSSGQFSKCYNLFFIENKFKNTYLHYHDLFLRQTGLSKSLSPYLNEDDLKNLFLKKASKEEKLWVDANVTSEKINIGFQFWTDEPTSERCWDANNVRSFCNAMSQEEVKIFNLTSYPKKEYNSIKFIDASHLSIFGVMYLVSKIDYLIGIDSCCGHIASLFNVPTITLWNEQNPTEFVYEKIKISFRPLRKNYSIVPVDGNIKSISYSCVLTTIKRLIDEEIVFDDEIISIRDTLSGKNVLYV